MAVTSCVWTSAVPRPHGYQGRSGHLRRPHEFVQSAPRIAGATLKSPRLRPWGYRVGEWRTATDESGWVQVSVDTTGPDVRVVLLSGWRTGDAASVAAATLAALAAARQAGSATPETDPPVAVGVAPADDGSEPASVLLHRAFRDLAEYRIRLAQLHAAPSRVGDPEGLVSVTLVGPRIVGIEIEPHLMGSAGDIELGQRLGAALTAAVRAGRSLPARALDGCPDLVSVLALSMVASSQSPGARR